MSPRLGAHVSIAGGLPLALDRGREIGCDTIQIFTSNQTQWKKRLLAAEEVQAFRAGLRSSALSPILAHDSYLINLASPEKELRDRSIRSFLEEMNRAEALGIAYLVFHPGAHTGAGEDDGLSRVADALRFLLRETAGFRLRLLIESTAGQGTSLGYRFEHLAALLQLVSDPQRLGICLDTCHLFAAGYDLRTPGAYRQTMKSFDEIVGIGNLYAFHLNDSRKELGSRVDRHEHVGRGHIGWEGFRLLLNDRRFSRLPMVIETPGEDKQFREDLASLRALVSRAPRTRRD